MATLVPDANMFETQYEPLIRESVNGILKLLVSSSNDSDNRPFARSGHMERNKLCWEATLKTKGSRAGLVRVTFNVHCACNLRPSIIYFVSCDQIVKRAYCVKIFSSFFIFRTYVM